jgi:hypothetical protein
MEFIYNVGLSSKQIGEIAVLTAENKQLKEKHKKKTKSFFFFFFLNLFALH